MSRASTLLKVTSILFIIFGAYVCIAALVLLFGGAVLLSAGMGGAGALVILATLISCAGGVLELVAGIMGVIGKKIETCRILAIIILAICAINLIFAIAGGSFGISTLIGLVLPILYFIGVQQSL